METSKPFDFFALLGPTGSGKTKLSEEIAELLIEKGREVEILAVDSVTVYQGFNIGSAKPSSGLRNKIPHHLIDVCQPTDNFTASDFIYKAKKALSEIKSRQRIPLVVGGSGFYFKALVLGMTKAPATDPIIENLLEKRAEKEGVTSLFEELKQIDPGATKRISPQDTYRIKRALAVFKQSGKTITQFEKEHAQSLRNNGLRFCFSGVCLNLSREELKTHMRNRLREMFSEGWLEEVMLLSSKGLSPENCKPMGAIGYKQIYDFIQAKKNLSSVTPSEIEALQEGILNAHLRLAKAQRTFFKKTPSLEWLHPIENREMIFKHFQNKLSTERE